MKNVLLPCLNFVRVGKLCESVCNGCFFKFGVEVGVELSIVNALYRLRITDQLFKSYAFTRVVRSQSTLQRLLRRQIKKNTLYSLTLKVVQKITQLALCKC
jgi:hypothetical protein